VRRKKRGRPLRSIKVLGKYEGGGGKTPGGTKVHLKLAAAASTDSQALQGMRIIFFPDTVDYSQQDLKTNAPPNMGLCGRSESAEGGYAFFWCFNCSGASIWPCCGRTNLQQE